MDIQIFVSCHKPFPVPEHPLLRPVQVGAALTEARFPGFLRDNTGEHISEKNGSYCELTAQYWAWKNVRADYYGFFHYRRYLYPDAGARRPYRVEAVPAAALLDRLGYGAFPALIGQYDLIAPRGEDMRLSVRAHYAAAKHHFAGDLEIAEELVRSLSPAYGAALEAYLSGTVCYFGNIFIMKRAVFTDYCAWLFPLLAEFDRRVDRTGRSAQEQRADGYLAERLFGVYYTKLRRDGARTLELPRVDFIPEAGARVKRCALGALFPAGSRRRAIMKRIKGMSQCVMIQKSR